MGHGSSSYGGTYTPITHSLYLGTPGTAWYEGKGINIASKWSPVQQSATRKPSTGSGRSFAVLFEEDVALDTHAADHEMVCSAAITLQQNSGSWPSNIKGEKAS